MKKSLYVLCAAVVLACALVGPLAVYPVSYPPQLYHRQDRHEKFVKGETLYLFHSGTGDVRKAIRAGDTLAVHRTSPSCEVTPVGIVRVIAFEADTYIKAEVFAGEIRPDDIARKEHVSCLVISAGICQR